MIWPVLFFMILLAAPSEAATINAASCSSSHVQAAIDSASTGDTVLVPSGSCTWTSTVSIANKGITLQGAGINLTNITDQGAGGAALIVSGASATNFVNISGITFIKSASHPWGMIQISGARFSVAFRFHHNRLLTPSSGSRGINVSDVYGLIDHNVIDATASTGSIQSISIFGSNVGTDGGYTPWTQPLALGSINAVYVEDNVITYNTSNTGTEDSLDAYSGARFVVRHNQINNISMGHHGTDSGAMRSPVSFEVYDNIFTNNSTKRIRGWTVRGGTGVFFNNTYGGTVQTGWYDIALLLYRACSSNFSYWQKCNGTRWEISSTDFSTDASRQCSTTGGVRFLSPNADQVSVSGTRFFDGSGTGGYPCRDQPGIGPGQVSEPIYAWNNSGVSIGPWNMADPGNCNGLGITNYIAINRDYFTNTPRPGYAAFTYPHPLTAGISSTPPSPPTNLAIRQ